jgi:lipopolysaccharide export LptBFGC system permease protein LptF
MVIIPLITRLQAKHPVFSVGLCLVVLLCFFIIYFLLVELGSANEIAPVVAALLPVCITLSLGLVLWDIIRY